MADKIENRKVFIESVLAFIKWVTLQHLILKLKVLL
jgi:hypothetical protein